MVEQDVNDVLTEIYKQQDKEAAKIIKIMGTTCTKKCDSCCYLLTTITLAEGILLAEKLLDQPNWFSLLPKLKEAALAYCYKGITPASYLSKKIPCIFLDTKERLCTIYDNRPGTCRYHHVISNPANCHPDHPTGITAALPTRKLLNEVWELSRILAAQYKVGVGNNLAPMPLMLLYCMMGISTGGKGKRLLREATAGLPTPSGFLKHYSSSILFAEVKSIAEGYYVPEENCNDPNQLSIYDGVKKSPDNGSHL